MGKDLKGKELGQGIVQRKNGRYEAHLLIDLVSEYHFQVTISRMLRKDIMNLFMRMKKKLTFERT